MSDYYDDMDVLNEPEFEVAEKELEVEQDKHFIKETVNTKSKKTKKKETVKKVKPYAKGMHDFEDAKKWLIKQPYEEFEDPDNHYCEFTIPKMVTLGEELVIKFSNNVKNVHYLFGDGYKWAKKSQYDPKSDYDIQLRPTIEEDIKDFKDKEIRIPIGKIKKIGNQKYETWLEGYHLCVVRVFGKEWHEDTIIKRMVKVVAK